MLTERGLRSRSIMTDSRHTAFEAENSLLLEYSRSDWALTCAWLFASILLDMLQD